VLERACHRGARARKPRAIDVGDRTADSSRERRDRASAPGAATTTQHEPHRITHRPWPTGRVDERPHRIWREPQLGKRPYVAHGADALAQARDDHRIDGERFERTRLGNGVDHAVTAQRRSIGELVGNRSAPLAIGAREHALEQEPIDARTAELVAQDAEKSSDLAALAGCQGDHEHVSRHRRQIELAQELDEREPDSSCQRRADATCRPRRHRLDPVVGCAELTGREFRAVTE
jgi:hypothetical protein